MAQPAEISSSSFTGEWTYDVFLSFRGQDTRHNFTGNLYHSLDQKGIHTFIDDESLRKGEEIKPSLLKAIQESRTAIVVFSENYASSTYCLDELVAILEHLKAEGRLVWPIFYDVDPSVVRHQRGSYAEALAKHEERYQDDKGKVQKWRKALLEAANLSGWHFIQGSQTEYKFITNIIRTVSEKLNHTPLHVADNPVGLGSLVLQVKSIMGISSSERVKMIGICGTGGIGKTTIARAVYNLLADQFDGLCFLADIREKAIDKHGLVQLQETLLSEILGEKDIKIGCVNKGIPLIKRRLQRKKVLLVLDDVDNLKQLKAIAGGNDWFGFGSRIIITSRDKHLLSAHGVSEFYEVKELSKRDALELFSWNAFKSNKVDPGYAKISSRVLSYAGGLPLALQVIGSNLYNRGIDEWKSALDKYERIPNKEVNEILKLSYDGLEEDEKNIFLDIACFFNKYKMSYVRGMLHAHGFHPEHGIRVLVDKSLVSIDRNDCLRMHDLIQDMGREIVRQESPSQPGKRSRLWFDEDIFQVLQNETGTDKVEVIILNSSRQKEVCWNGNAFQKMRNLRVLIVGDAYFSTGPKHLPNSLRVLDWVGYPSTSLPSGFNPTELSILSMISSCLKFDKPLKVFCSLSFMNFEDCNLLRQVPSLFGLPNLRALCLDNCTNLVKVHYSVGFLKKLILLSAQGCSKLQSFVSAINLPSLETLDLKWCTSLESFPEVLGQMENLKEVYLDHTAIKEFPFSIHRLIGLERLFLRRCKNLNQLPVSISLLPKLEVLIDYKGRGYRLYEPHKAEEALMSKVFVSPSLEVDKGYMLPFAKAYCITMIDYNVIQEYPLSGIVLPEKHVHFGSGSSVSFWFRERFPKVTILLIAEPSLYIEIMHTSVCEFRYSVVINGINQLNSSCDYIICETRKLCLTIFLGDLQRLIEEGAVKRVFSVSKDEQNHVEVSCELKYHMPYDPKHVSEGQNRSIEGTIKQSTVHGDMHDILLYLSPYCKNSFRCYYQSKALQKYMRRKEKQAQHISGQHINRRFTWKWSSPLGKTMLGDKDKI
ncbi:TMV resistance protein N-like [Arachis ipaensis]|uniref:TMV resistance protein N-like n=1 Tax=Arachis ipaensis TaxID=130454 RepID=UPI0007AF6FAC|nr:TMV resistance protein N-like [Arachis ipaensis]XP_016182795.1 TMV resistance protein N-like [Arachis ipaensis]XP_016182796.1 TMV resistance protein N-like [Arachis ipaensis]XP_025632087.1 TMV resistance protein N [Arachis hypogaea]XP_025632088.1 TMV resistance protein N [Arachis hypogaea]QHO22871.1 TMV resistance protein N [Arachis hypogaea]QHO22872.1 TMV resistance protein N [Arachis hypogaea]